MKKGLFALALTAASVTVAAADWQLVAISSSKDTYEMDYTSVARVDSLTRKAWFKEKLATPERVNYTSVTYVESRFLIHFRCASKTSATAQRIYYSEEGKMVDGSTTPKDSLFFSDVVPDTVGQTMLAAACAQPLPAS